jgi:hypothetical protein
MTIAAQAHAIPLRRFTRMPSAGSERSRQSVSSLLSSLCGRVMASPRCMQIAALAPVALLAAEAWGVSNALATRGACPSQDMPCELSSTLTTPRVDARTQLRGSSFLESGKMSSRPSMCAYLTANISPRRMCAAP